MATNSKPSAERALDGVEPVDAAEEDERHRQRLSELTSEGQEEGFLERELGEDPLAEELEAQPDDPGLGGDELGHRDVARGRSTCR